MYVYLYDAFLQQKKYASLLARIETRLTDLGIGGKIYRLSPLRNSIELIADEARAGAKTIIAVGSDKTFSEIVNAAAPHDVTIGTIPVGSDIEIAKALGIYSADSGCNIVAARNVEHVDVGRANNSYFLSLLNIGEGEVTLECEEQFNVTPSPQQRITIYNLRTAASAQGMGTCDPRDGFLEVIVESGIRKSWFSKKTSVISSVIPFKHLVIRGKESTIITTDGGRVLKTPVVVDVLPQKLKLIVGKSRLF